MSFDTSILSMLAQGFGETVFMVLVSSLISYLIGIPLGLALVVTDRDGICPKPAVYAVLGAWINLLRSVPFIILLIAVLPLTRLVVGTTLGPRAVVVPLVISAAPYVARMVESSLKEVNTGVIEAAKSMGASNLQIVCKVLLPEARPALLIGAAISVTTILGYSTMAGGLGTIAINYGYYRYRTEIMLVTVVILVLIVQGIQECFLRSARRSDHRAK